VKQQPVFRYVVPALAWWLLAASLLGAGEYEELFGRHLTRKRGETHARFTADLLILGRTGVQSVDILFSDPTGGPRIPLLNTADLDIGAASLSGRYDLIFSDNSPYELQFTLSGFPDGRKSKATRMDPDIVTTFFGRSYTSAPFDAPTATTGLKDMRYDSQFGSGEVNLRQQLGPRATWFSGFRYVALQEDLDSFSVDSVTGVPTSVTRADADNSLYGYQIGVESTIWTIGKARIDVIGRGGVFLNKIEARLKATIGAPNPSDPDIPHVFKRQDDGAAFAGDLQATLIVPLGRGALRLGYQVFWVNRVALLPNQLDDIDFSTDTGSFDLTSPVYQGGFVGLEFPRLTLTLGRLDNLNGATFVQTGMMPW